MMTRLAAVAVGAMVATFGVAGTASATESDEDAYSTSFWDGGGVLTDDFGDHDDELGGSMCDGCSYDNGPTVRAWQAILFVEGYLRNTQIDGDFGPNTAAATRAYQDDNGLGVDGQVGPSTWGHADGKLRWTSSRTHVLYRGAEGSVTFERGNSAHGNAGGGGAYRLISACVSTYCESGGGSRIYH